MHKGITVMNIPNRMKVVDVNKVNKAKKGSAILQRIREAGNKKRLPISTRNSLLIGTFAARFPQIPDVGIEQAFATGALYCSSVLGLCEQHRVF